MAGVADQVNSRAHSPSYAPPGTGMSSPGDIDQCEFGSSAMIRHGLGDEFSKEGLPRRFVQEQTGGVEDAAVVAQVVGEAVVTEVMVIVEAGGIVGHVVGIVVLEELELDELVEVVTGGAVATQEQALEILATEEEQGLAKAGKVETGGLANQSAQTAGAWTLLF